LLYRRAKLEFYDPLPKGSSNFNVIKYLFMTVINIVMGLLDLPYSRIINFLLIYWEHWD